MTAVWKRGGGNGGSVRKSQTATPGKPDTYDGRKNQAADPPPEPKPDWQGPGRVISAE